MTLTRLCCLGRDPCLWTLPVSLLTICFLLFATSCSREQRAESYRERAREYFEAGDYERARLEYLNLVRALPEDPEGVRRLGMILQDQGALLQAMPVLIKAVELEPGNAELKGRLAQAYLAAGGVTNALSEAWVALDLDPGQERATLLLAEAPASGAEELNARQERLRSYRARATNAAVHFVGDAVFALRDRDVDTAQQALTQALQLNDQMAAAHFLQASIYESSTNLVEADRELKRAVELSPRRSIRRVRYAEFKLRTGAPEEGRDLLEALVKDVPDYLPAIYAQAQVAFTERRLEDALGLCTRLLERYPLHLDAALLRSRVRILRDEATLALEELERLARLYGRVPQYRLQLAVTQLANREPNRAMATLEELVDQVPGYTEAVLVLGKLNLQRGRAQQAIDGLNRFVQAQPGHWGARLMLADAHIANRQYERALTIYREFTDANPKDARGPFLVGLVLRQQKQLVEARQAFEGALAIVPEFLAAAVQLVELDLAENAIDAALARTQGLVEQAPEIPGAHLLLARVQMAGTNLPAAEVTLNKVLDLDASVTSAYLMLATLYKDDNRLQPALERLNQLLQKDPNDVRALMLKATVHTELGQLEKAREAYEVLLTVNPNFSPALNNLAYLYTDQLPDLQKAWRYARRARELLPDAPEAADTLGWVHFKRGEYLDALRFLTESAEKLPGQPEVQYHLGMTHYMMAQESAARTAFERALQSTMEFQGKDEARRRLALLALDTEGGGADARRELEAQLKLEPQDVLALVRLADVQLKSGELKQAQETLGKALEANPNLPQALVTQGRLKAQEGQREEALRLVRRAREAAPSDGEIAWRGGQVALTCNDVVLAQSLLQEAARRTGDRSNVTADLAEATYLAGRLDDAQRLAQRVIQANPEPGVLNQAKALDWCIQAYRNPVSAAETGEATLAAMLQKDPNYTPAQMATAGVQVQKGRTEQARVTYEQVLGQLPNLPQANRELALLFAGPLKDDAKAYDHAVKARQALLGDAPLTKVLGLVTYRRGDLRYAEQLLKEAAKDLPEDEEIKVTLKEIEAKR